VDTPAETLPGRVPEDEIVHGHRVLLDMQKEISREKVLESVGTRQEVLLEARSAKEPEYLTGRTRNYKVVRVQSDGVRAGDEVEVDITKATGWTLYGTLTAQAELRSGAMNG
jgi:tRNA-2-methylthio-N6-dimethylallyladenosine synthase